MGYFVVVVVGGGQTRALTNSHVNSSNIDALCDTFPVVGEGFFSMPGQKLRPHRRAVSRDRVF